MKKIIFYVCFWKMIPGPTNEIHETRRKLLGDGSMLRIPYKVLNTIKTSRNIIEHTANQSNLAVLATYDENNQIEWTEFILDEVASKSTKSTQFQSLAAQTHKINKIFDASTAQDDPEAVTAYLQNFIHPWIKNPSHLLDHHFQRGPVTKNGRNYTKWDNCITIDTKSPQEYYRLMKNGDITCSFEDSLIFWDKKLFLRQNNNYDPDKSTILRPKQ
eukprot:339679_1